MANVIGIIAELDPLHNGHKRLLDTARDYGDFIIIAMSGDYTQRGTPSAYSKWDRTQMALSCGADLVIELPVMYSTSSAEGFATGAVSLLSALGADTLLFGSESGDINELNAAASFYADESGPYRGALKEGLRQGLTYAAARSAASPRYAYLLDGPNNVLGIEYIKAIQRLHCSMSPQTILRTGSPHESEGHPGKLPSAASIRRFITAGGHPSKLSESLPSECITVMENSSIMPPDAISDMLYYKLRYALLPLSDYLDISLDLGRRIEASMEDYRSFTQYAALVQSKNYTLAHIRRALLHILLDISKSNWNPCCSYARVLGLRRNSAERGLFKAMKPQIPLISSPSSSKTLSDTARDCLDTDIRASRLYDYLAGCSTDELRRKVITL